MIEKDNIKKYKTNGFKIYVKNFKSKKRKSIFHLFAYLFDKDFLFNKDFRLERIADRAGLISLCLSDKMLNEIIIEKALKIESCKIMIFNFSIGTNFPNRLLIFFIYLLFSNFIQLRIQFFNFEESF